MFLKQATASQEILLGPFVDDTDGKTAETGLTIANTDIQIWKSGATTEANKNSGGATHIAAGRYYAVLDATDTDTVGMLEVNIHVSGALPVRRQFYVLEEAVYDQLFAASAPGAPSASAIRSEIDSNSTQLAAIVADTSELQTDLANGGRLDLLIDAIKAKTDNVVQIGTSYTYTNDGSGTGYDNVTITVAP